MIRNQMRSRSASSRCRVGDARLPVFLSEHRLSHVRMIEATKIDFTALTTRILREDGGLSSPKQITSKHDEVSLPREMKSQRYRHLETNADNPAMPLVKT